mmetsp:Transcript_2396/g.3677  ORF Transcript_2396/g.3677 Transcript_2396/m.3677 type:complete len:214 (+) Transcript_2396:164-805(+)
MQLSKILLVLASIPTMVAASCINMKQVTAAARINSQTNCNSMTDCPCRYHTDPDAAYDAPDTSFLQCDPDDSYPSFPTICSAGVKREGDCTVLPDPVPDYITIDLCDDKCPSICRLINNALLACDPGAQYKGTYPLVCQDVTVTKSAEKECVILADIDLDKVFHEKSDCFNNDGDYCSDGKKCRFIDSTILACDEKDSFVGIFPALCPTIPID